MKPKVQIIDIVSIAAAIVLLGGLAATLHAQPGFAVPSKEEETVQMATNVLDEVMAIPANAIPQSLLSKARAVAIVPNVVKGGFVIGIRHGRGVVLIRDDAGNWQAPLFISLTSGSVGWQAGVQATDLIMVFQTRKSVNSLMNGRLTLGVDAAAAAGPVGRQATAATDVTLSAEILSYSRSRGLFAGFALDGAGIQIDNLAAASYYHGQGAGPNAWAGTPVVPPSAVALVNRLALYTGAPPVAAPAAANPGGDARAAGELMRQQVVAAWQRLAALLDPNWQAYLQPPRELLAGGVPATEAVTAALQHYEAVAVDPKYAPLSQRPEFTSTHQLLREYLTLRSQEDPANLRLPPPP